MTISDLGQHAGEDLQAKVLFVPKAVRLPLDNPGCADKYKGLKIRLRIKDKTITATLIDNKTTRDFISLLPLTLTMNDLFHREKFAHLPKAISTEGERALLERSILAQKRSTCRDR